MDDHDDYVEIHKRSQKTRLWLAQSEFLRCIYEYLRECEVPSATLYGTYIRIIRRKRELNIAFATPTKVMVQVSQTEYPIEGANAIPPEPPEHVIVDSRGFDISDPDSLADIHEFVTCEENA